MGMAHRMQLSERRMAAIERSNYIKEVVQQTMIAGYVVEFGVAGGISLGIISKQAEKLVPTRKVFGFDSFEGLPEEWSPNPHLVFAKGCFSYDPPDVRDNVELIKGWFEDTIPVWKEVHFGPVAFLHIDSDLYSSCATILTELNDQIVPGTIILFDELINYMNWEEGEWKALQEWLTKYDREVYELSNHVTQVAYQVTK